MSIGFRFNEDRSINRNFYLFLIFFLVSISDATSISIGSGNIRIAWILLPFLAFLLPKFKDDGGSLIFSCTLFAIHIISSIYNDIIISGSIFSFWIIFNYFFFFRSGYIITKIIGDKIWDAILALGRLQIIIGCALQFAGIHERTQFTYYEPSYLAIGITPYILCTVFWSQRKLLDYLLISILLITSQSANLAIAISLTAVCYLFFSRKFAITAAIILLTPTFIYLSYWIVLQNPENPNYGLANWINQNGIGAELIFEVLRRAGNRVPRIEAALEILNENWWLGVGPGKYIGLTSNMNFDHLTDGISYYDPSGLPAINIIIESMINSGIGGAIIILAYSGYIFHRVRKTENNNERQLMLGSLLALFTMLQIESSYLRAYVWLILGVFLARTPSSSALSIDLSPEHPKKTESIKYHESNS